VTTSSHATTVGRYTLLSKVGEGGMGVVHLAEYPPGHHVAIKLLRPHVVSDDHGRARMAREVTSLRRVRSPRVAEVYDADPWGETPYIVTRFVPGPSLQDRVGAWGPLQGVELEGFARGLAQALAAVHAAGVLHRDIKPSNVLLEGSGPVLIDFGLAQLCDDARITYSGWLLGTPGYLAPEILYGDDPTPQADVHSWAATVVYAATGRGPYGTGPAIAVMDRVRRGEHDLAGVPDALYWLVRQCLSPDPHDRPSSGQVADWLSGAGPAATATSATSTAVPQARRAAPTAAGSAQPGAGWGATQVSPAPVAPGALVAPVSVRRPGVLARLSFWGAVGCLLVAGFVTAPVVAAVCACLAGWVLRTAALRRSRLDARRARRGHRRGDSSLATLCTPWYAAAALPGAALNAVVALTGAALAALVATLTTPPRTLVLVLALAGVVTGVIVYWGPFSGRTRDGGAAFTAALLRSRTATLVAVGVVLASALGLLVTRQVTGPTYSPLPPPPWASSLHGTLP
jgi:hypothetical protein